MLTLQPNKNKKKVKVPTEQQVNLQESLLNDLSASIEMVNKPTQPTNLSDSVVFLPPTHEITWQQQQEACAQLHDWLLNKTQFDKAETAIKMIITGCHFYSVGTGQAFSEGTFCLVDPNQNLINYVYTKGRLKNRPSSHLPALKTKPHKGYDLSEPIILAGTPKRTVLIIAYTAINSTNMLLVKPENASVISFQHLLEYFNPPTGSILRDRKERVTQELRSERAASAKKPSCYLFLFYNFSYAIYIQ